MNSGPSGRQQRIGLRIDHAFASDLLRGASRALAGIAGCVLLCTTTGCSTSTGRSGLTATEKMMWSTYPLGTQKGMATGFAVDVGKKPGTKSTETTSITLVSSLHAIATVGRKPLLIATRFVEDDGTPTVVLIQIQQPKGRKLFFVRHPKLDLAAFRVRIPVEAAELVQMPTFLSTKDISRTPQHIRPGTEVSFLGYPEVLPGTEGAFPVLRSGKVASYAPGSLGQKGKFVINADVYPGDSGAPVFANHGGKPRLVGMIIQRIGTEQEHFSHLAVAVDAAAIRETLDLLAAAPEED